MLNFHTIDTINTIKKIVPSIILVSFSKIKKCDFEIMPNIGHNSPDIKILRNKDTKTVINDRRWIIKSKLDFPQIKF